MLEILDSLHYIAVSVIAFFVILFIYNDRKNNKANAQFPSLLITIGIAFTFLGIALGLKEFDTEDPASSLSFLVDGIKTAFWGSLFGVVGSIVLKAHAIIFLKENAVDLEYDEKLNQFYQQHSELCENSKSLKNIDQKLDDNNQKLIQSIVELGIDIDENNKNNMQGFLTTIVNSLSGVEQIQRNTQNLIAGEISELRLEFIEYANKQAEINTQIFIQALENTIEKFNANLIDTLGENFKHLNKSIENLVEWQGNYAQHVEVQTDKYSEMATQIHNIKVDFSQLLDDTNRFNRIVEQLNTLLLSTDQKNNEFSSRIESFYAALDSKVIDIENTRRVLDQGFLSFEKQLISSEQSVRQIFNDIHIFIQDSHKNSLNVQTQMGQELQNQNTHMHKTLEQSQIMLNNSLSTLESKLQETLNQSLKTLGQQLGSLSSKFADDYEPITINLKKILDNLNAGAK